MPRLEGKVALISGGARGQGAVEARMFAGEGAKVVIGDILDAEGQQVESGINEGGGECVYVRLDVTSEVDWQQAVETVVGRFGKLDVLVNNAGIGSPRGPDGERVLIETLTEDQWDRTLDVNAKGVFLGTKAAILRCARRAAALIINISSVAGLVGGTTSAYGASKGAVRLFTKATAIQYAREGIRANSVHPGVIITAMTESMLADEEGREMNLARHPIGRAGSTGRRCLRGLVPGQRRVVLHDGKRVGNRRRTNGPIAAGSGLIQERLTATNQTMRLSVPIERLSPELDRLVSADQEFGGAGQRLRGCRRAPLVARSGAPYF